MIKVLGTLFAAVTIVSSVAASRASDDHERALKAVRAGEVLPLTEILKRVAVDYPGDIVEVELEDEHGRLIYEVELVSTSGRMIELEIDAKTGEVLEVEGAERKRD